MASEKFDRQDFFVSLASTALGNSDFTNEICNDTLSNQQYLDVSIEFLTLYLVLLRKHLLSIKNDSSVDDFHDKIVESTITYLITIYMTDRNSATEVSPRLLILIKDNCLKRYNNSGEEIFPLPLTMENDWSGKSMLMRTAIRISSIIGKSHDPTLLIQIAATISSGLDFLKISKKAQPLLSNK